MASDRAIEQAAPMLILGGARSGKSRLAESIVADCGLSPLYIATARASDTEMAERICAHRSRRGDHWQTVEIEGNLPDVIQREAQAGRALLVDCLTLWLAGLFHAGTDPDRPILDLAGAVAASSAPLILVSNEIGLGLVPETPLGRRFRDAHGLMNQKIAGICKTVLFVAAGLPVALKGLPYNVETS